MEEHLINENVDPQINEQAEDFPPPIPIYDPIVGGGIWPSESSNADLANYSLYDDDDEDNV